MLYGYMDPYTLNPYRALTVALKGPLKGSLFGYMDPQGKLIPRSIGHTAVCDMAPCQFELFPKAPCTHIVGT